MSVAIGLIFAVMGLSLLTFARPTAALMVRQVEWQLGLMRRPWFVWYYRAFGIIFAVGGISLFFSRPE